MILIEEQARKNEEREKAEKIEAYAKLDLDKNGWYVKCCILFCFEDLEILRF